MSLNKFKYIGIVPLLFALSCGDSSSSKDPAPEDKPPAKPSGPQLTGNFYVETFGTPAKGLDYGSELALDWKSNRDGTCTIKNELNQVVLQKVDALPATGQIIVTAEEAAAVVGKQSTLVLQLDCEADGIKASKSVRIPVSRFSAFKATNESPKSKDKVYLSWTSENLQGTCTIDGKPVYINPFEIVIDESPRTVRTVKIMCPGFKKKYEASLKLFVVPDNSLAWYIAADFTLNSKPIDSEIEKTHYIIGHGPIPLSWKAAEGVSCVAWSGFSEQTVPYAVETNQGVSSILIDSPRRTHVTVKCSAPDGQFPQSTTRFSLTIERRSVWGVGGSSLTSMLLDNKSDENLKTQAIFAGDTFRLYAYLDNIDSKNCQIGLEGEAGGELIQTLGQVIRVGGMVYRKPPGQYKAWVQCKIAEETYRKSFSVEVAPLENQPCPEKIIKIVDQSQLSLPAACPAVPLVLMAIDSIAWEPLRSTGTLLKLKLAAGQTLKVDHHYDVIDYGQTNTPAFDLNDLIFTYGYLPHGQDFEPLLMEIEGGPEKKVARLEFELVKAAKVSLKNVEEISHDLIFRADEKSEFNLMDLRSVGRISAGGNRQVRIQAPMLTRITGDSLGSVSPNALRSRPSIGGLYLYQNISLIIQARLESVTGEFTIEKNPGEVSLVQQNTAAVGVIDQPLKEILKTDVDPNSTRIHQRLNGSLLIAGNEVLQKVSLPLLSRVEGGGIIGKFKNLGIINEYEAHEVKLSLSENARLLELSLGLPESAAHELKILPTETALDLGDLDPTIGFGNILRIVRDPQLTQLMIGQSG